MWKKTTAWIRENLPVVLLMGLLAVICWLVPLASGDDWTFASWYKGLNNFPDSWLWIYAFFNGRPTIHLLFSLGYYLKLYCVLVPLCIFGFFWAGKRLLKLEGFLPQLLVACLLLCFSWNMKRNIYLWVVGSYAYWITWTVELCLFAVVCKRSTEPAGTPHQTARALWVAVGVFFFNFGTENMAVGVMMLYVAYVLVGLLQQRKPNRFVCFALAAAVVSGLMCVCNPAGTRYEETMSALGGTLGEMVRNNLYTIVDFLILQNYLLYIFMGALLLLLYRQLKLRNRVWLVLFSVQYAILVLVHLPWWADMEKLFHSTSAVGEWIAAIERINTALLGDHLASILFWLLFFGCLFWGFFLVVCSRADREELRVILSLFVSAAVSAGVFIILPEISERVMFYALSVLILYCGYLARFLAVDDFQRKAAAAVLCLVILVQFDQLYFHASNAHQVTCERERIIEEYHTLAGLGLADDIHELVLPAYAPNSINWSDYNCNPDEALNPYAYNAFKAHYKIPDDVKVIIR